jgi:hypothetical protein
MAEHTEIVGSADDDRQNRNLPTTSTPTIRKETSDLLVPGKRLFNPLGKFASYNYQISLYMITPDAYDAFIQSGRRRINAFSESLPNRGIDPITGKRTGGGALLVAQSGGINNKIDNRAPGFTNDFGIDNLSIKNFLSGPSTGSSSNVTEVTFSITEPYGFSFLTKLRRAADAIEKYVNSGLSVGSSLRTGEGPENPAKQFFILGIRFYGYDIAGNPMTGSEKFGGSILDPTNRTVGINSPQNAVFETFYDIAITSIKFKIDGNSVTYNCEARAMPPKEALGARLGAIKKNTNVTGKTVGDVLRSLMENLTNEQQADTKKTPPARQEANTYAIKFIGDADQIDMAEIATPEDINKYKYPGSTAKSQQESNPGLEVISTPDKDKRSYSLPPMPIIQAINQVISQSTFLRDALQLVYTTATEPDFAKKVRNANRPNSKAAMKWYTCNPVLSNARWDKILGSWTYDITYQIQIYLTPVIDSAFANPGSRYYGPHKRYKYWYTGENSEIIGYTQQLDTAYYNIVLGGPPNISPTVTASGQVDPGANQFSTPRDPQGVDHTNAKQGLLGSQATATPGSVMTSLYDPKQTASATINILGDPDFLMQDTTYSEESQIYNRFYGTDGFTVDPNGGQVFVEIDFNEPVDYSAGTGLMNINESILFWKYPESLSKLIQGICYQVVDVKSTFNSGKFEQTLNCKINAMGAETSTGDTDDASNTGSNTPNNGTGNNTGSLPGSIPGDNKNVFVPPTDSQNPEN